MLIKNVTYSEQPPSFEIRRAGSKAVIVFPCDVEEIQVEETEPETEESSSGLPELGGGTKTVTQYVAHNVYQLETNWTQNLEQRVSANLEAWKARAMIPEEKEATLSDVIEAVNTLTEIILGGE